MYAVIKAGGKQHKVQAGDVIEVEKILDADETLTFTPLLVVDDDGKTHAGPRPPRRPSPPSPSARPRATRSRSSSTGRRPGTRSAAHRQQYTLIEIEDVSARLTR